MEPQVRKIKVDTGMSALSHHGRFRLVVMSVSLRNWKEGWQFIREVTRELGWWPVICGMDFWVQGMPIIRTTILVNVLIWLLMYSVLR